MSYQVKVINDCTKKIIFTYEGVDLSSQVEALLKEKQKTVSIKGFRKGKAPLSLVKQAYGPEIENKAFERFVSEEFYNAIESEKLQVIGHPSFGNVAFEEKNMNFEATIEVYPEISLKDYSKYEFKKEDDSISEKDILDLETKYLEPKSEMLEITDESRAIENGIFVIFNFEGEKEDGTRPDSMKANDFSLEIGSGQFIPGFEEGMIGLKKGEKKSIELTFPEDYHEEDLKNASVKFHVEVLELKEKKIPELTDELSVEFGFESVEDFKAKNKQRLEMQKKREIQMKLQEDILKKMVEENSFDVPTRLVEEQKKSVREELSESLKRQGLTDDMLESYFDKWTEDVAQKAEFQVRSGLVLDNLARKYEVEATEDDFDLKIQEMASQSGVKKEEVEGYYAQNKKVKMNIMYAIREEKTFDKIIGDMVVE